MKMFSPPAHVAGCCAATAWGHTSAASAAASIFSIDSPDEHGNLSLHDDHRLFILDSRDSSRDAGTQVVRDAGTRPRLRGSVFLGFGRLIWHEALRFAV